MVRRFCGLSISTVSMVSPVSPHPVDYCSGYSVLWKRLAAFCFVEQSALVKPPRDFVISVVFRPPLVCHTAEVLVVDKARMVLKFTCCASSNCVAFLTFNIFPSQRRICEGP